MILETIIACAVVIFLMVFRYERKLKKAQIKNDGLIAHSNDLASQNNELMAVGRKTIFDYNVLTSILQDNFEDGEIEKMFAEKKEYLMELNDGKDEYDGRYF
jgi:hypothetical protein